MKVHLLVWLERICVWPILLYRRFKFGYSFRRIYLGEGEWTIVEPEDYCRLNRLKWHLIGNKNSIYAVRDVKTGPTRTKLLSLHREIMKPPVDFLVDHINCDPLDNRRANLRLATRSQNQCNKRKTSVKTSSRFIGVYFDKYRSQWAAAIHNHTKKMFLGRFDSETEAAKAYDAAAKKYHGEFARLNFP